MLRGTAAVFDSESHDVGGFTEDRREPWLYLVGHGCSQQEACAEVDVSSATISRWRLAGSTGRSDAASDFAERLDAVVEGTTSVRLTEDDLIRLMEAAARKGSVTAIKYLLDRLDAHEARTQPSSLADQLAEIRERKLRN